MLFHVVLKSFDCHSANFRKNFRKSYKHFWFLSQFVLFAIFLFGGRIHLSQCMDWLVKKLQWVAKKCGCICGQRPLLFRSSALLSLQKKGQKLVLPFEGSSSLPQPTLKTDSNKKILSCHVPSHSKIQYLKSTKRLRIS